MSKFRTIVEQEIKKVYQEDAYSDREDLLFALNAFENVIQGFENKIVDTRAMYTETSPQLSLELNTDAGPLVVALMLDEDDKEKHTAGIYVPTGPAICIYLCNMFDLEDWDAIKGTDPVTGEANVTLIPGKSILELLSKQAVQSTFVHEFQHFMDDKYKNFLKKAAASRTTKDKDTWYWNSPHEKNAHYLAWILKIAGELYSKYGRALKDLSPIERLDFLKNEWQKHDEFMQYYNLLDAKSKKRFLARLYNYFSTDFWK